MSGGVLDSWREALVTVATVGAPLLVTILVVGIVISLIQAATQISENVLVFVPKLLALAAVLALAGPWLLDELADFTRAQAGRIVDVGREGRR